jgi:predicted RNA-binding Zn-ribbon protein involved in translation (DUF1610 family)
MPCPTCGSEYAYRKGVGGNKTETWEYWWCPNEGDHKVSIKSDKKRLSE